MGDLDRKLTEQIMTDCNGGIDEPPSWYLVQILIYIYICRFLTFPAEVIFLQGVA